MKKPKGKWVVYERSDGQFVFLTKPVNTRKQAEQERVKFHAKYPRAAIGVGFVRIFE